MKWKSELVWKGNRRVWKLGIKDRILVFFGCVALSLFIIGVYFLGNVRFNF